MRHNEREANESRMTTRTILKYASAAILLFAGTLLPNQVLAQTPPPAKLLICEAVNDACTLPNALYTTTWNFEGTEGTASLPNGSGGSRLTVESFDGQTISIR